MNEWNAREALYAFCGWLTSRDEATVMGAVHPAGPAAERIDEFAKKYGLAEVREGWHNLIRKNGEI